MGLGSWLFHMTLQYEMQLLDELPMLWGSCILIYCMCQIRAPINSESATLALTLTAIAITLSIIHLTFKIAILFFVSSLWNLLHFFDAGCVKNCATHHTVRNLHVLSKISTLISREKLLWMKNRENVVVLGFLAVDNFDFTRKIVKIFFCQNWIFGQKFDFSNSVTVSS